MCIRDSLTAASNMENSALRQLERMGQLEAECAMTQMRVLSALKPIGTRVPPRTMNTIPNLDPNTTSPTADDDVVAADPYDSVRRMILRVDPSLLSAPANHVLPVLVKALREKIAQVKATKAARAARPPGFMCRARAAAAAKMAEVDAEAAENEHGVNSPVCAEQ
eukprot:TRINITY_DN8915_c0_g1_i1.p1 TRINITY_DN8915_c0_g1~~TRINITY_DN8915_c0_g1_i1.p1  ORF type:complete len:165 (-),score=31.67 TRINITY_DN8915_c0_g1_i1:142-636(-)